MKTTDAEECADSIELRMPCKAEYVRTARALVGEIAKSLYLSPDEVQEVQIAASEAIANIIRHAYGPGKRAQPIFLRCRRGPGQLSIEVIDRGIGFKVPTGERKPDPSREGGLGILLIRSLMDQVEFWSKPNAGTRIRMMKLGSGIRDGRRKSIARPPVRGRIVRNAA